MSEVDQYFLSFLLMFIFVLIKGLISGTLIRPVVVYTLVMMLYPIVTLFLKSFGLLGLYWWVPSYGDNVYVLFSQIALAAVVPLVLTSLYTKKIRLTLVFIVSGVQTQKRARYSFSMALLFFIVYVFVNFKVVLAVDYNTLKNESNQYLILTAIDYLIFFTLLYRCQRLDVKFNREERFLILFYVGLKVILGGRMFLAVDALVLLLVFLIKQRPSVAKVRSYSLFIPFLVVLMAFVVAVRERTFNFFASGWSLSQEYLNSCLSALNISETSLEGNLSYNMGMLLDPLFSMIPSSFLDRDEFFFFQVVDRQFGGIEKLSPIGGAYLPHQVYLILPNLFFVFLYFCIFSFFIYTLEKKLLSTSLVKVSGWMLSVYIGCLSILLVFSVRHFFYVHIKTFLMVFIGLAMASLLGVLWSGITGWVGGNEFMKVKKRKFNV